MNATTLTKRRQLETFIAKNRAKASTASQASSKAKQLERLQLIEIEGAEVDRAVPLPRDRAAARPGRCAREHLAIGYPDHTVARDVHVEIEHGTRVGVVGDNGQGKTTFLRTICGSLPPLAGELNWGYGCQMGVYAQHVYTTLPEDKTVLEYLEYQAAPGTNDAADQRRRRQLPVQRRDDREAHPRAQRRRAGPARAGRPACCRSTTCWCSTSRATTSTSNRSRRWPKRCAAIQGTVIFTSHDRHFMHRVATHVIEVRAGRVASYPGSYDDYVYRVQNEIDTGLRAPHAHGQPQRGMPPTAEHAVDRKARARADRDAQKKLKAVETARSHAGRRKARGQRKIAYRDRRRRGPAATRSAREAHQRTTELEEEWLELRRSWNERVRRSSPRDPPPFFDKWWVSGTRPPTRLS